MSLLDILNVLQPQTPPDLGLQPYVTHHIHDEPEKYHQRRTLKLYPEVRCVRCGWKWKPRAQVPSKCANCLTRYWNKE